MLQPNDIFQYLFNFILMIQTVVIQVAVVMMMYVADDDDELTVN